MRLKKKIFLASCICILLGSNILTYAISRRYTTALVRNEVRSRIYGAVERQAILFQNDEYEAMKQIEIAIRLAGGHYAWANEAVPFYAIGISLIGAGIFMPFAKKTRVE